jgi:alcohol dehydrogenase (cytochrome c)
MKRITFVIASFLLVLPAMYSARQQNAGFVPVTDQMLQNPDPADWLMWRRTLNSWGYSPLDQINRTNVRNLKLIWTRGMGPGVQEATPLVYRGVMYLPSPSDFIEAMNAATGDKLWEYKREWKEEVTKILPVPSINRNLAIYGNTIIDTSADDFVFALDATTGKLAWENSILDMKESPAQETSGPIVAKGKIISGRGCEARKSALACVIVAHDAKTGKELWRTRTVPMPGEFGDDTWGGLPYYKRSHVGTWMVPSYDPELNMLFVGTSVTSPAPKFMLAGNDHQYLYHNSTLALNADTGKIVWYYQHLVDHWDFDHPFERLLVDTVVAPSQLDQSENPAGRTSESRDGCAGKDGHCLYARS